MIKYNFFRAIFLALVVMMVFSGVVLAVGSGNSQLMVGTAIRDVTPTEEMLPIPWHAGRTPIYEDIYDPLHLRMIAISSGEDTMLMVCTETGRGPQGPLFVAKLAEHTGLPMEAIFYTTPHVHSAPEIKSEVDFEFEEEEEVSNHQRWGKLVMEQMLDAADEALGNMKPASVGIGYSKSYINTNRNSKYNKIEEDGTVSEYYTLGWNPEGPTDRTLAAIRFNDENGDPIAFIINYAMHATVMHANTIADGNGVISSDVPGTVSGYLEEKYDGSVAMWLSGAAGDQNPIIQNEIYTRNPMTGEQEVTFSDSYDILAFLSKIHFADIETALANIKEYKSDAYATYKFGKTTIPAKDGGEYPVSLQMLRIDDIALAGFHGEMYVSIGKYMKENSILKNTLIVNHTAQKEWQELGYHPDDEALLTGKGYRPESAGYKPGYIAPALTTLMNSLIEETSK